MKTIYKLLKRCSDRRLVSMNAGDITLAYNLFYTPNEITVANVGKIFCFKELTTAKTWLRWYPNMELWEAETDKIVRLDYSINPCYIGVNYIRAFWIKNDRTCAQHIKDQGIYGCNWLKPTRQLIV